MKRTRKRKRLRKQPRKLTPPLVLRDAEGNVDIIEVDHETVTTKPQHARRMTALLYFGKALSVKVGSRCINKRRVTVLHIENALTYNMP